MLLFVCQANLCRSPMAERFARRALAPTRVASAGTHAHAGMPMHPGAARTLREAGLTGDGFTSRRLTGAMLDRAEVVLTATRQQRGICVGLNTKALHRTFTLRQFGRLAAAYGGRPGGLGAMLKAVPELRAELPPSTPEEDDLGDPVNGTLDDMRACLREIERSLAPVLALISAT